MAPPMAKRHSFLRSLFSMGLATLACLGATAAGCSSSHSKASLAASCQLNSDCEANLVCTFGRCHAACEQTRDCSDGERCVSSGNVHVCQLDVETSCSSGTPCTAPLVCGPDGKCRNECASSQACLS